jgi:excisionase family DNA binding protein
VSASSEELITVAEAAHALAVSPRTVARRIAAGDLPVFRDRGVVRIRRSDLNRYIAHHTKLAARPAPVRITAPTLNAASSTGARRVRLWDVPNPMVRS